MRDWAGPGWYSIDGTTHWANGGHEHVTKDYYFNTREQWERMAMEIYTEVSRVKREPEYYQDKAGEWRWRVRDANGEIIDAASEGFSSRDKAEYNYGQN